MPTNIRARERLVNRLAGVTSNDGTTLYVSPWLGPDEHVAAYGGRVYLIERELPTPTGPITVSIDNILNDFLQHTEFWFDAEQTDEGVRITGLYVGHPLTSPVPDNCRTPYTGTFSSYFATREAWIRGKT